MRLVTAALVLTALLMTSGPSSDWASERAPGPPMCGTRLAPPARWEHIVWIWFENHDYDQIVGSHDAPFMNRTLASACGLATNYHALGHPSLPNYIAATSGLSWDELEVFRSNCNAQGRCRIGTESIFEQARSWSAYAESMPKPCTRFFTGQYAASHTPAVYYEGLTDCPERAVDLTALPGDLDADRLGQFVFITPNMCHSMHNCSVHAGDAWLRRVMRLLTTSPAYARGTMAIFVTFDESDKSGNDHRIATFVVSPSTVPGTRASQAFTHYSLLRTTDEMLGLPPLGRAQGAPSMRAAFNL